MNTRFSIFGYGLLISALFTVLMVPQSVNAYSSSTSDDQNFTSTLMECPTAHEFRVLGDHERDYNPYKCEKQLTIREAVGNMENAHIYFEDNERDGFLVRFPGELVFANEVADLPMESNSTLRQFAGILKNYDNAVNVRGHASTPNISTIEFPSNQALSEARAKSVAEHLINVNGVSADRLSMEGFGEELHYNNEINDSMERLNRRVDFFIKN